MTLAIFNTLIPKYTHTQGRAEPIRLAFLLGSVDYEDERVQSSADFQALKPTLPYGSLPILHLPSEDDDNTTSSRTVTQSIAMLRYAGKLAGLYPMDADLALTVDEVVDVVNNDVMPALQVEAQEKHSDRFVKEIIPRYVEVLDRRVGETSENGPFVLGDHVTIADLMICKLVNEVREEGGRGLEASVPRECVDHCEHLMRSYHSVMSIPEVKEWHQSHNIPNVTE